MKRKPNQPRKPKAAATGPASHNPAPHYMSEEFDIDHVFRDLLNQAKDINPDRFAFHYHHAAQELREEAVDYQSPRSREQQIDDLFGGLLDHLFTMWGYAPDGKAHRWTEKEEDDYIR